MAQPAVQLVITKAAGEGIIIARAKQNIITIGAIMIHRCHERFMGQHCAIRKFKEINLAIMCPVITTEYLLNGDRPRAIGKAQR